MNQGVAGSFASFLEHSPTLAWMKDGEGRFVYVNPQFATRFERPVEEFLGRTDAELFPPDVARRLRANDEEVLRSERPGEWEEVVPTPDGRSRCWRVSKFPFRDEVGRRLVGGMAVDITERKSVELQSRIAQILAEANDVTSTLPRVLEMICQGFDWEAGEVWKVDPVCERLRRAGFWHRKGADLAELLEPSKDFTIARGQGLIGEVWAEQRPICTADGRPFRRICGVPLKCGAGVCGVLAFFSREERPVETEIVRFMESLGSLLGLFLHRLQAAQELARSGARLRAIVDTAVDAVITIDERGNIEEFNRAAEQLFGYSAGECLGRNVSMLMPQPVRDVHDRVLAQYLATGKRTIIGTGREVEGLRKDGSLFPVHISIGEARMGDHRLFTAILHDLTERKRLESELVRTQNLAAVGEMAAAIVHEIKNPLAAISLALQVLQDEMGPTHPRHAVLDEVQGQIRRLDGIVRQLLLLSKPWEPVKERNYLQPLTRHILDFARNHPSFMGVALSLEGNETVMAAVDPQLFEQVVWNLLLNSAEAITTGGEIRIAFADQGEMAEIRVSDTGPGIPPRVLEKLFRPFVTTKPAGTGLGLPICRKIMEAHGGAITIESSPGRGTTATLRFPK